MADVGTTSAGAGSGTISTDATAEIIRDIARCDDAAALRFYCQVAATGNFRLNYLFSPDSGTTWVVGKQVTPTTITVDGNTVGYVRNAQLDIPVGFYYKVEAYNYSGGSIDFVYDYRAYTD